MPKFVYILRRTGMRFSIVERSLTFILLLIPLVALTVWAHDSHPTMPERPDDLNALPRFLTREEMQVIRREPLSLLRFATPPPSGPLRTPGEFEPIGAILMAYTGTASWKSILDQMAYYITTAGNADVHVIVPNAVGISEVHQFMGQIAGADMRRVFIHVAPINSIWIRDYGPGFAYLGDVRVVIDHTYNRPRPLDNAIPRFISNLWERAYHQMQLVHAGGNYHIGSQDSGYTTHLVITENPGLTETRISDIFEMYYGLSTWFSRPLPANIDPTQHIDMWFQPISEKQVMISNWPFHPDSVQAVICDSAAAEMMSLGYIVHRVPALVVGGTHYSFVNAVMCNGIVLIPSYTNSSVVHFNHEALSVWQEALPDKTIIQVNAQAVVRAGGALHCMVKHVPAHLGGTDPTVFLRFPAGGEVLEAGETLAIEWISDHIAPITAAALHLSLDGGETFDLTIAESLPNEGDFDWVVPPLFSPEARVRVTVRDNGGRAASHTGLGPLTILPWKKPIASYPWTETFEEGSATIDDWSQVHVAGTNNWIFAMGAGGGSVSSAYEGSKNARFTSTSGGPYQTRLVTPMLDLSSITNPVLSFWYAQEYRTPDQNELKVYYRTNPLANWVQLYHDDQNRMTWTQKNLRLPDGSSTYQVAFEGIDRMGQANVLDHVSVSGHPGRSLRVTSSGVSGVFIEADPPMYCGTTDYSLASIPDGTQIRLTAPATKNGSLFASWTGCDWSSSANRTCTVAMNRNKTVRAIYLNDRRTTLPGVLMLLLDEESNH